MVKINEKELVSLKNKFIKKQSSVKKIIQQNFVELSITLEKEFSHFLTMSSTPNLSIINTKLALVLYRSILYYDTTILNLIPLRLRL